jgi:hypothetical protein
MKMDEEPEVVEPRWASLPPSATLRDFIEMGSLISAEDADQMQEAIEEGRRWVENAGQEISA